MGLLPNDLKSMVYDIFEVDSFKSKMGEDKDIVTLSFSLREKAPAEDLVKFLENGYNFILDADVTAGEQSDGTYKVFVELQRDRQVHENIFEIIDGVGKLSGLDKFKFRYYKNFKSNDATMENLDTIVPKDPNNYGIIKTETQMHNYKNFFNKSYIDSVDLVENTLILKKAYANPISFEVIEFGNKNDILENINGQFDLMESYPEILFLTKYIGDYNISKYGDKLVFENQGNALVVKRN